MSILDTFVMLFESDASKLDKGLKDSEKKAEGLQDKLKSTDVVAGKLGGSLVSALAGLAGAAVAAVGFSALTSQVMQAAEAADALNETSQKLGINIETLSAWGDLVKKNGGSAEGFANSIAGLDRQLSQMEVTGKSRAAPFLKELGIDLEDAKNKGKSAMDFLPQLADSFAGLSAGKAQALGARLGLDQATIMTLQQGRRAVDELLEKEKELGVITEKQGQIADDFGDQMDDTKHAFRSVFLGVSEYVLPPLTWMMKKFQDVAVFLRKHSDFVVGLMIALGAAILFYALPPLASMAAAAIVAFAPFILMGLAVAAVAAAFALLYDDVMNFIDGNDSLIGQILEKYPIIGDIVQGVVDVVKALGDAAVWVFNTMASVLQIAIELWSRLISTVLEFTGVGAVISDITSMIMAAFGAMGDFVTGIWDAIIEKVSSAIEIFQSAISLVKSVAGAISGGLDSAKEALGIGEDAATKQGVAAGQEQLGAAARTPMGAQTSNSINEKNVTKNATVNVGTVTVQTQATDAAGISKAIGGSMQAQMKQAATNFDDGVLA